jgi:hypothetical protein
MAQQEERIPVFPILQKQKLQEDVGHCSSSVTCLSRMLHVVSHNKNENGAFPNAPFSNMIQKHKSHYV